ncbi:hypothetical protein [Marinimicrobium sp. ABcell2]|uniref:hypothetical protein n=1 Tax=Marinimicrobium sp. ABcell2 TaxID=3069751 RepID=UPI0027B3A6C7|nr:hypothetical protein [Marinimicrobium sp. ABcell2]MDQ2077424.1 hypothetical protein [Marinimicrobium sp. ABcell2]
MRFRTLVMLALVVLTVIEIGYLLHLHDRGYEFEILDFGWLGALLLVSVLLLALLGRSLRLYPYGCGRAERIVADFPGTKKGLARACERMRRDPSLGLLEASGGRIRLTDSPEREQR